MESARPNVGTNSSSSNQQLLGRPLGSDSEGWLTCCMPPKHQRLCDHRHLTSRGSGDVARLTDWKRATGVQARAAALAPPSLGGNEGRYGDARDSWVPQGLFYRGSISGGYRDVMFLRGGAEGLVRLMSLFRSVRCLAAEDQSHVSGHAQRR